jgi:hypothetical protein
MRLKSLSILSFCIFGLFNSLKAQKSDKCSFNGYLSGMPQYAWTTIKVDSFSSSDRADQYLLHNRLNFNWYPSEKITGTLQFRNQLLYGDFTKDAGYNSGFHTENYFLPLTYYQTYGDAGLLSLSIDRAWLQYTQNNIEIKMGRQRINWGQTFVWNPNDIFNTYNFFDFDYVERPGVDAVRIQYYPNYTSSIELAAKIDSSNNVTAAGLYRFNRWSTDFQLIGAYYSQPASSNIGNNKTESDWVSGFGITSDYKGISFRTEVSYFYPAKESTNQNDLFLVSIGFDHSFKNELYLSSEFFYSSRVEINAEGSIFEINSGPLTVKNLAYAKYNAFVQASYPLTPLFKVSLSGMYFTDAQMTGYFVGPNLDYSLLDNLDLALYFQFFDIKYQLLGYEIKSNTSFAFLRLKWSF